MEDENKINQKLIQDEISITNSSRKTVTVELNRHGVIYSYPGTELVAKNHSKTFRIGEFQQNYTRKCDCCDQNIPTKFYEVNYYIKPKQLYKYGIDLSNFFIVIDNYFHYISFFYLSYFIQTLFCLLIFGVPNVEFNLLYFELYYQLLIYDGAGRTLVDVIFSLIRIGLVLLVYRQINKKLKKNLREYKKKVYDEFYVDEAIYSMFVKNLPKLTEKEDLIKFLTEEYKVNSIRDVILLKENERIVNKYNHYTKMNDLKNRMEVTNVDVKYDINEFVEIKNKIEDHKNKLKSLINETEINSIHSGTAIVIFEKNEDKNLFFRKNHHTKKLFCCYKKKPHIYKGKKIYFEVIPPINQINWKYAKYSLEKIFAGGNISSFISFIIFALFSLIVFYSIFSLSKVRSIKIMEFNIFRIPFVRAIFILIFNKIFETIIIMCLSIFNLSDNYFNHVLIRYLVMQKTFFNTIIINIMLYQTKLTDDFELEYLSFFYFLILLAFKSILFTRFSENYIIRRIKYFFLRTVMKRKMIQLEMNDLYSDNNFDVIRVFEKHRLLVYTCLFLMKLFPISAIFFVICVMLHYVTIKWSLFNSCLKNINYHGYYFNLIMRVEFTSLFLIISVLSFSNFFKNQDSILWYNIIFCILNDVINILHFKTTFNKFTIEKSYKEMEGKFKRRFKDEKFIDLNLLKKELGK